MPNSANLKTSKLDRTIRNLARGGRKYQALRGRLYNSLRTTEECIGPLSSFLSRSLFKLDDNWQLLDFSTSDRRALSRLLQSPSNALANNYLSLATAFIRENADSVATLLEQKRHFEKLLFEGTTSGFTEALLAFSAVDEQSLLFLRLYAASHQREPDKIIERTKASGASDFVKRALLYPLVYYFGRLPQDLDLHLQYVLPGIEEFEADRAVIRTLLNDDLAPGHGLAFTSYLCLLLHPVDARDLLLRHFERTYIETGRLSPQEELALTAIHQSARDLRSTYLVELIFGDPGDVVDAREPLRIASDLNLPAELSKLLTSLTSLDQTTNDRPKGDVSALFWSMRKSTYPNVRDYDEALGVYYRYWFTDIGRFMGAFLISLYLLPRRDTKQELTHLLRLRGYIGAMTTFVASGPSGREAVRRYTAEPSRGITLTTQRLFSVHSSERLWLKSVQWQLSALQEKLKINEWLHFARRSLPIEPDYLTGIQWAWLENIIDRLRIKPFLHSVDAVYVFLLRLIELKKNESNKLRTIVASLSYGNSFDEFVDMICTEFQTDAIALVRYFLTADMILYLHFTDNYIQAMTLRMEALENCIGRFGFNSILSESTWKQEASAFTTELMLLNVGRNQFEVNWEALKRDIITRLEDHYRAHEAFRQSYNRQAAVFTEKKVFSHQFATGVNKEYATTVGAVAGIDLLCNIIDAFIEHPSQGIESILSIRIRHNPFRREFAVAFDQLRSSSSPLTFFEQNDCLLTFEDRVYAEVAEWLDQYMHQVRPDKPNGLFDFVPDGDEMRAFEGLLSNDFPTIVAGIIDWLRERLNVGLTKSRESLVSTLGPSIQRALSAAGRDIAGSAPLMSAARVEGLLHTTLAHVVQSFQDWFRESEYIQNAPISGDDMRMCLEGYYETEITEGLLSITVCGLKESAIASQSVRPLFNLCCTVIDNALKYRSGGRLRLRVQGYSHDGHKGILFSNMCSTEEPYAKEYHGNPVSAEDAPIFKEGKSGLYKVAAISAYIAQHASCVRAHQTRNGFHLFVPTEFA